MCTTSLNLFSVLFRSVYTGNYNIIVQGEQCDCYIVIQLIARIILAQHPYYDVVSIILWFKVQ